MPYCSNAAQNNSLISIFVKNQTGGGGRAALGAAQREQKQFGASRYGSENHFPAQSNAAKRSNASLSL